MRGRTESVDDRGDDGAEDASECGELSAVRTKSTLRVNIVERDEDSGRGSDALWVFSVTWGGGVNGTGHSMKVLGFCRVPRVWMVRAGRRFVQDEARSLLGGDAACGESIWQDMALWWEWWEEGRGSGRALSKRREKRRVGGV